MVASLSYRTSSSVWPKGSAVSIATIIYTILYYNIIHRLFICHTINPSPPSPPLGLLLPPLYWVYSFLPSTGSTPPSLHWVYSSLPSTGSTPPSSPLGLLLPPLHWVYSSLPPLHWVYSSLSSTGSTPPSSPLGLLLPLLHWVSQQKMASFTSLEVFVKPL